MIAQRIRFVLPLLVLLLTHSIQANAQILKKWDYESVVKTVASFDGSGYGYIYTKGKNSYVVCNGVEYWPYTSVDPQTFQFSDVWGNFWFVAKIEQFTYAIVNGKSYGPFDTVTEFKIEPKKNNIFSFRYSKDRNDYINLNDVSYGPYESIDKVTFSEDEWSYGFTYKKSGRPYVNINGQEYGESYSWAWDVRIALDGRNFWFAFVRDYVNEWDNNKVENKNYIMVNGVEYGPYDSYAKDNLKMSKDGTKYLFSFGLLNKNFIMVNGKIYGGYNSITDVKSSLDYDHNIFKFTDDKYSYINYDRKVYGPYLWIENVTLSQDGESFAFVYRVKEWKTEVKHALINGKDYPIDSKMSFVRFLVTKDNVSFWYVASTGDAQKAPCFFIDWKQYGPFAAVFDPASVGNSWAVWVTWEDDLKDYVYVNGVKYGPYDYNEVEHIQFSSDNEVFLFNYKKDSRRYIFITDTEYWPYDQLDAIKFSLDGKGYSYRYSIANKGWYTVVNGKTFGPYDRSDYLNYLPDGVTYNFRFEKKGMRYINFNWVEYGPYDSFIDQKFSEKNSKGFGFIYKNGASYYAIVNNKTFWPFEEISDLKLSQNNFWSIFKYKTNGKYWVNYNWMSYWPCEEAKNLEVSWNGTIHTFSCRNGKTTYAIINELSLSDKKLVEKKRKILDSISKRLRAISKEKLQVIYVKIEKMMEKFTDRTKSKYITLKLLSEIINEEIQNRISEATKK